MDPPMELIYELANKLGTLVESTPQLAAESVPQNDLGKLTELLQRIRHEHINRFVGERKICNLNWEIASCTKELNEHEASIERDRRTLEEETAKDIKRNAEMKKVLKEQRKANENLRRFAEEYERERKESLRKVNEIEGRIRNDRDDKVRGRENVEIEKKLEEKQLELDDLYQSHWRIKDELREARRALIEGWVDVQSSSPVTIGIKRMGEIDEKEFTDVCRKRFPISLSSSRAVGLCSSWQKKLSNPEWHPFRIAEDEKGNDRIVIKEDDDWLQRLKKDWGDEIYNLVTTALMERQEYKVASGCCPVFELWNYKEKRKATTKEAIEHMLTTQRKKRKLDESN